MLKKDKFKLLYEKVEKIKRIADEQGETLFWEAHDAGGEVLGFAFYMEVPESLTDMENAEEFDKYEVWGIVNCDLEIIALAVEPHPEGPENVWAADIIEPQYSKQYIGLSANRIALKPYGEIDAITDATISSKLVSGAIRTKIDQIRAVKA